MTSTTLQNSPFLRACRGEATEYTPIWMMRQAGRYMANYRAIRAERTMLECINTPEIATEITLQPIDAFGMDAAIIFSDILPPLQGMGLELEFVKGRGPVIYNPISSVADVEKLDVVPTDESMAGTLKAIELTVAELASRNVPLIGFCGAPFTLASYAIEGGSSKNYAKTKQFIYENPESWVMLMTKLVAQQADYLIRQAQSGASALQIFDSWAGAWGREDYIRYILPYNKMLMAMVKEQVDVPMINFSTGTSAYLDTVASAGGDVIGVDWRLPIGEAWDMIGRDRAIMGNLDPLSLLAPWAERKVRIDRILEQTKGHNGHIFNLGHGILPSVPVEHVKEVVDYVQAQKN